MTEDRTPEKYHPMITNWVYDAEGKSFNAVKDPGFQRVDQTNRITLHLQIMETIEERLNKWDKWFPKEDITAGSLAGTYLFDEFLHYYAAKLNGEL